MVQCDDEFSTEANEYFADELNVSLNVKTGKELVLKQNSYRILNYVPLQEHQRIKKHDRVGPPGCLHTVHTGCYGTKIQASVYFCFITGKQSIRVLFIPCVYFNVNA